MTIQHFLLVAERTVNVKTHMVTSNPWRPQPQPKKEWGFKQKRPNSNGATGDLQAALLHCQYFIQNQADNPHHDEK